MKFFKCEDGTIFSINDICSIQEDQEVDTWEVLFNLYYCSKDRSTYNYRECVSITQADYERLVRVLEEEGMLR